MACVLVIRPDRSAHRMAARLQTAGYDALACPISAIEPRLVDLPASYDGILLTSPHALHDEIIQKLLAKPVFCVGKRAADAATAYGLSVMFVAEDSAALSAYLAANGQKQHFLYLSGADIHADLADHGFSLSRVVSYEAVAATTLPDAVITALQADDHPLAILTSVRSLRIFACLVHACGFAMPALRGIAISPAVAKAAEAEGIACVAIADAPHEEALIAALARSC